MTITATYKPKALYRLTLGNGSELHIEAGDRHMEDIVAKFGAAMKLHPVGERPDNQARRMIRAEYADVERSESREERHRSWRL